MKKTVCILLNLTMLLNVFGGICLAKTDSAQQAVLDIECQSAILIERDTGEVLYEKDAQKELPIASVTKIMTMLLIMEALRDGKFTLESVVTCSEHAVSMGGSQIYLKEGESLSVNDMLKAIAVASANDAAVAMGEYIAGSDTAFVSMMNEKAKSLGMKHTHFVNCTGLDADGHYSCADDIAIMSKELLKYDKIRNYTTIWMDSLRDGKFGLTNTNKLVRFYQGCTGLKTGSTSKALYCMSASAEREGMELIAVVLASPSSAKRFENAKKLLDYGFANYEIYSGEFKIPAKINVKGAKNESACISGPKSTQLLVAKGTSSKITVEINLKEFLQAPAEKGTKVGEVNLLAGEKILQSFPLTLTDTVAKATFIDKFLQLFGVFLAV